MSSPETIEGAITHYKLNIPNGKVSIDTKIGGKNQKTGKPLTIGDFLSDLKYSDKDIKAWVDWKNGEEEDPVLAKNKTHGREDMFEEVKNFIKESVRRKRVIRAGRMKKVWRTDRPGYKVEIDPKTRRGKEVRMSAMEIRKRMISAKRRIAKLRGMQDRIIRKRELSMKKRQGWGS